MTCENRLLLHNLPTEVRDLIFAELLVTDFLAEPACLRTNLSGHGGNSDRSVYDLSPSILRCCRQIYDEASAILYEKNTFIVIFDSNRSVSSPIFRYQGKFKMMFSAKRRDYSTSKFAFMESPLLQKIKRWRLLPCTDAPFQNNSLLLTEFYLFCKALRTGPILSLKVVISPTYIDGEDTHDDDQSTDISSQKLSTSLLPLKLLSNVTSFELLEAPVDPDQPVQPIQPYVEFDMIKNDLTSFFSKRTTHSLYRMFDNLLQYAQTFERVDAYRSEMEPRFCELAFIDWTGDGLEKPNEEIIDSLEWLSIVEKRLPSNYRTPYKFCEPTHPVERALQIAGYAWENGDLRLLRKSRSQIISYLEPQYQRITNAARNCNELIKFSKRNRGVLSVINDGYYSNPRLESNLALAVIVYELKSYAAAFVRDALIQHKIYICSIRPEFDFVHSQLPREMLLKQVVDIFYGRGRLASFLSAVRGAVDDMDKQFFDIRAARNALFDYDGVDYCCDIDLDKIGCNDFVDWTVNEPDIGCESFADSVLG